METLSFAFGVLSMVGLLLVITIVLGAVKVLKQQKQIKELNQWMSDFERNVWQEFHNKSTEYNRYRDDLSNLISTNREEVTRYVDSRLDKLEQKLTSTLGAKQILKG